MPDDSEQISAAGSMAAQRSYLVASSARDKNRLRSILLESCPAFKALVGLSDPHCLHMLSELGGPWGIVDAGKASLGAVTRGAERRKVDALRKSISASTRPGNTRIAAENGAARMLARRIAEAVCEADTLTAAISGLLSGDDTYRCPLTVHGIGPRIASELAISIDIDEFRSHDRLASYCSLAPRNRQSGTSISSVAASRQCNKRPKNLMIFSCNSPTRSRVRFGEYYRRCRDRGMCHGQALKVTARKRLKVIYAVMRDRVPYAA